MTKHLCCTTQQQTNRTYLIHTSCRVYLGMVEDGWALQTGEERPYGIWNSCFLNSPSLPPSKTKVQPNYPITHHPLHQCDSVRVSNFSAKNIINVLGPNSARDGGVWPDLLVNEGYWQTSLSMSALLRTRPLQPRSIPSIQRITFRWSTWNTRYRKQV